MEMEFVRHEPCYDRILFVLTLDRKKMKERILIGEELQVRFRLQGDMDADVLCDTTRPLGTFLAEFEHDPDGEWNRLGLAPLREAVAPQVYGNQYLQTHTRILGCTLGYHAGIIGAAMLPTAL